MKVFTRSRELASVRGGSFVPTMGALHRGHAALIAAAKASGGPVVVSIFVNPTQFGPAEDFERYPRPIKKDLELCEVAGVDAVFTPSETVIYPPGFVTEVRVPGYSEVMCGATRPGHFNGVATVVARLLGLVRPARAYFGWKDAQQLIIIRRLAEDLALGVSIQAVETVREPDGLAVSSRNAYLSSSEREKAPALYQALRKGETAAREGARAAEIVARVRRHLRAAGLAAEYVELRRVRDLAPIPENKPPFRIVSPSEGEKGGVLLAAAVRIGETRLIDNVRLGG